MYEGLEGCDLEGINESRIGRFVCIRLLELVQDFVRGEFGYFDGKRRTRKLELVKESVRSKVYFVRGVFVDGKCLSGDILRNAGGVI